MKLGEDVQVIDPDNDARFRHYWERYHQVMGRRGVTPEMAKAAVRRSNTLIAALMVMPNIDSVNRVPDLRCNGEALAAYKAIKPEVIANKPEIMCIHFIIVPRDLFDARRIKLGIMIPELIAMNDGACGLNRSMWR